MATMQPAPPPPPPPYAYAPPPSGLHYAGFWIRFLGVIIDAIILGIFEFIVVRGTGAITVLCPADTVNLSTSCPGGVTTISPIFWIVLIIVIAYYPVLWGLGGTLGQRMLGLRVVDANSGKEIGIARGFLRFLGYIVASIAIYIGLIWAAFDPRKQGWHDKIANSLVIYKA